MNRACPGVATMCRVLGVSPVATMRGASAAVRRGKRPMRRHRAHPFDPRRLAGTYGRPRIHAELAARGWRVGGKRIARLMRTEGLAGVSRRKGTVTTVPGEERRPYPDRVERDFRASTPDELYVADITYVPTGSGFLYLAVVLDVFSRRIVGWRMATHRTC